MRIEMNASIAGLCAAIIALILASQSLATLPPPPDVSVVLFFRANTSDLEVRSIKALEVVSSAVRPDIRYKGPILVTGYEDSTEKNGVGWERAAAVAQKLRELGFPASRIFVGSRANLDPLTCAGPEVLSTCNARVEVGICTSACSDGFRQSGPPQK